MKPDTKKIVRRKRFIIKPHFQLTYLFFTLIACGVSMLIFSALSLNLIFSIQDIIIPVMTPGQIEAFRPLYVEALISTISITLIVISLIIFVCIYYSHRFAGPVFRIEQDLNKMMETGEYYEINVRRNDYLKELVEIVNSFIRYVSGRKNPDE